MFYTRTISKSLGEFGQYLPHGGMWHDQNAYMKKADEPTLPASALAERQKIKMVTVPG